MHSGTIFDVELGEFSYRNIIRDAWTFTRENKRLMMWYSFLPSLLTTLVGILYLSYQFFAFKRSALFENAEESFLHELSRRILEFFTDHKPFILPAIIVTVVVVVLYLLLPTLCQGGLIRIIARMRKHEHVRIIDGVSFGILVFLPLLEYHLAIRSFSVFAVLTEGSFVIRNLGADGLRLLMPFFIIFSIVALILSLLFTYSEFFIVLEKKGVLSSIGNSCKLVILNWQHTFLIGILMLIIGLRVIINVIAILLVPALVILSAGLIATVTLAAIGIIIAGLIGLIALLFASYFNAILNMFANTVWTFTFLALREEKRTEEFIEKTA